MAFFKYCPACENFFTTEESWKQHNETAHKVGTRSSESSAKKWANEANKIYGNASPKDVPGDDSVNREDERLEKAKELRVMKKYLKQHGVECQTMDESETTEMYKKILESEKGKANGAANK